MALVNMMHRKWYTTTKARDLKWHDRVEEVLLERVVFATGQVFRLYYVSDGRYASSGRLFVLRQGSGIRGKAIEVRGTPQYFEENLLELHRKLVHDVGFKVGWTNTALQTWAVEWLESLDPRRWFGDFATYNDWQWDW